MGHDLIFQLQFDNYFCSIPIPIFDYRRNQEAHRFWHQLVFSICTRKSKQYSDLIWKKEVFENFEVH